MPRFVALASAGAILALALAGCTATGGTAPEPGASAGSSAAPTTGGTTSGANTLPGCEAVTAAIGDLAGPLTYDEATSELQTAPEDYEQRVCVYTSTETKAQLSITLARIPFQQSELDAYAASPNSIADDRLQASGAVIQTLDAKDSEDGLLDSPLYLFDTVNSVTIYPISVGEPISTVLPGLTIAAAIDAAFAVRGLLE